MKKILITGIGGNVGQGVLMNTTNLHQNLIIIGADINQNTAGNHLCNKVYKVPYAYTKDYIPSIKAICLGEKIDLIIPTTDFEVYHLAEFAKDLPTILGNPFDTARTFLDKYLTWEKFKTLGIPFANSWTPETFETSYTNDIIAKPRKGRGSRGIVVNPKKPKNLGQDYMIQEYIQGIELTSAIYVTKDKKIIGPLTFERVLESGATQKCWVNHQYDDQISSICHQINSAIALVGPLNIQSRVTSEGRIVPFEINGRYSGTNSIRSQLGFNDVEMGINEHLFGISPVNQKKITKGVAVRLIKDVVYPDFSSIDEINNNTDHFYQN
ncbi:ATP-grasp domain-containing protein [Reichenbachiella sp. MSK19-1]|uniref:ATP-grasp domain-containing protein n=1 Tax=Reichenbachiella sp. MSK19-1 TaxID=1897631 RepID=UPI000E6CC207|nr:ATP-grasp domain-containing protein [Reichenbachiella sp. MSK19-1]RJE70855.1 hypothetical protein BGP76_08710 [Reichenbachiella sp. MSK19-1]